MRRPRVRIRARWLRVLRRRAEPKGDHRTPRCQPLDETIRETGTTHRFEEIEVEVVCRLCERAIAQHAFHQCALFGGRYRISQDGQDVRLLAECASSRGVAEKKACRIP